MAVEQEVLLLITTYNRGDLLRKSFGSLAERTPPDRILVVDDGGDDDTEQVCKDFEGRLPIEYLFHNNPGTSLCSEARNVGLKATDAEIIITCEPEVAFISDVIPLLMGLHEPMPWLVINAGWVQWGAQNGGIAEERLQWTATYCALYCKEWLMEIGGWDESFPMPWGWDDTDILTRLRMSGHGQINAPHIEVFHQWHSPTTIDQMPNAKHFMDKDLENSDEHLVANKGEPWGILKA